MRLQLRVVGVLRIGLVDVDQRRDVLHHARPTAAASPEFQCRSMNTKATTDCSITIGTMMMSSARA